MSKLTVLRNGQLDQQKMFLSTHLPPFNKLWSRAL